MEVAGDFRNAENQKHDAGNTVAVDDEDRTCETFLKKKIVKLKHHIIFENFVKLILRPLQ